MIWTADERRTPLAGKDTLARRCSLSDRAVDCAVDELEQAGFVDVVRSRGRKKPTAEEVNQVTELLSGHQLLPAFKAVNEEDR